MLKKLQLLFPTFQLLYEGGTWYTILVRQLFLIENNLYVKVYRIQRFTEKKIRAGNTKRHGES